MTDWRNGRLCRCGEVFRPKRDAQCHCSELCRDAAKKHRKSEAGRKRKGAFPSGLAPT